MRARVYAVGARVYAAGASVYAAGARVYAVKIGSAQVLGLWTLDFGLGLDNNYPTHQMPCGAQTIALYPQHKLFTFIFSLVPFEFGSIFNELELIICVNQGFTLSTVSLIIITFLPLHFRTSAGRRHATRQLFEVNMAVLVLVQGTEKATGHAFR